MRGRGVLRGGSVGEGGGWTSGGDSVLEEGEDVEVKEGREEVVVREELEGKERGREGEEREEEWDGGGGVGIEHWN